MRERLVRWGCWLGGHAIIRPDYMRDLMTCRCGSHAVTGMALATRYR